MEASATVREVMMIEEDWQIQFIDFIREFKLPPHVEAKSAEAAASLGEAKVLSSSVTTYTNAPSPTSS